MSVRRLFHLDHQSPVQLRRQLQGEIVKAIARGEFKPGDSLPSLRLLARDLDIARNTVSAAYKELERDGILERRERVGYFVTAQAAQMSTTLGGRRPRLRTASARPSTSSRYCFDFLVNDAWRFPYEAWNDCAEAALSPGSVTSWSQAHLQANRADPMFLDQLSESVLPRRGILEEPNRILATATLAEATFLAAWNITQQPGAIGIVTPTMPQLYKAYKAIQAPLRALKADDQGLIISAQLDGCRLVEVWPCIHARRVMRMSVERMKALLDWADAEDAYLLEFDILGELNLDPPEHPSLKSLDRYGRVIYVSSFAPLLGNGIRGSYAVVPDPLLARMQDFQAMTSGGGPKLHERMLAHFIAEGHFHRYASRVRRLVLERREVMRRALAAEIPEATFKAPPAGAWFRLDLPDRYDLARVRTRCAGRSLDIPAMEAPQVGRQELSTLHLTCRAIEAGDIPHALAILANALAEEEDRPIAASR